VFAAAAIARRWRSLLLVALVVTASTGHVTLRRGRQPKQRCSGGSCTTVGLLGGLDSDYGLVLCAGCANPTLEGIFGAPSSRASLLRASPWLAGCTYTASATCFCHCLQWTCGRAPSVCGNSTSQRVRSSTAAQPLRQAGLLGGRPARSTTALLISVLPAEVVLGVPNDGSAPLLNNVDGAIVVLERGRVPFATKVRAVQEVSDHPSCRHEHEGRSNTAVALAVRAATMLAPRCCECCCRQVALLPSSLTTAPATRSFSAQAARAPGRHQPISRGATMTTTRRTWRPCSWTRGGSLSPGQARAPPPCSPVDSLPVTTRQHGPPSASPQR